MNKQNCKDSRKWWQTLHKQGIRNVCSFCTDKQGCELNKKILAEAKE